MSLEIQHISKFYGKTQALNDVTVTFEAEKIYGLLGRNGAGKTTLLNLIAKNVTNYIAYRGFLLYLLETENIPKADKLWAKEQAYRLANDMEAHAKAYADAANAFERENPYNFSSLAGSEHISEAYAYMLRELADGV